MSSDKSESTPAVFSKNEESESTDLKPKTLHHRSKRPKRSLAELLRHVKSPSEKKSESEARREEEQRKKKANGERFLLRVSMSDDVFDHLTRVANGPRGMSPKDSEPRKKG